MSFVDREDELQTLRQAYASQRAQLVVVYGRRRIGKTALIRQFLATVPSGVYLVVNYEEGPAALRDVTRQLTEQLGLEFSPELPDFHAFWRFVTMRARRERVVVAVDEFQRLHGSSAVNQLQAAWDQELSRSKIVLLLLGSAVGMVERLTTAHEAPLYGRATRILRLTPLRFPNLAAFLPSFPPDELVRTYSVFGGVPAYLTLLDPRHTLMANVRNLILEAAAPLREEPLNLLAAETREPDRYLRVLQAIAEGAAVSGEIADRAAISNTELPKYLGVLERQLALVERRFPLLERRRGRARYRLTDGFFRFWFRFIGPHLYRLERGDVASVEQHINANLDHHASVSFEELCLEHLIHLQQRRSLSYDTIGPWWSRDVEIDYIALDRPSATAYFVEAEWSRHPLDRRFLNHLIGKTAALPWQRETRREHYVLYSRSGFTFAAEPNVHLYSLDAIVRDLGVRVRRPPKGGSTSHGRDRNSGSVRDESIGSTC